MNTQNIIKYMVRVAVSSFLLCFITIMIFFTEDRLAFKIYPEYFYDYKIKVDRDIIIAFKQNKVKWIDINLYSSHNTEVKYKDNQLINSYSKIPINIDYASVIVLMKSNQLYISMINELKIKHSLSKDEFVTKLKSSIITTILENKKIYDTKNKIINSWRPSSE